MAAFLVATTFGSKPGQLEKGEEEFMKWVEGYREAGATVRLFRDVNDGSGMVTIAVEWPDAASWAKSEEDPRMLEVARRLANGDMPFVIGGISHLQELPLP